MTRVLGALVARTDATIADNQVNFGQVPGGGSSQRLPRLVGRQRALAHILTGERLSGTEAAAWGLANRAVARDDFEAAVRTLAERLVGTSRQPLARIKRLVRDGLELPLADALAWERAQLLAHLAGHDAAAGIGSVAARGGR